MPAPAGEATIEWNRYPQMRLGLCILCEDYPHTDWPKKLRIFNKIFAVELARCGFDSGVPDRDYDKIAVQWRDSKKSANARIWRDITTSPWSGEGRQEVDDLKKKVGDAANELGLAGGLGTLPVYDGSVGVGNVAGRGVRVAVKKQGAGSGSDEDSSPAASGDEEQKYQGLGSVPPKAL